MVDPVNKTDNIISGLAVKQLEEDRLENDRLRGSIIQDERKIKHLENILQERDNEISRLKLVGQFSRL